MLFVGTVCFSLELQLRQFLVYDLLHIHVDSVVFVEVVELVDLADGVVLVDCLHSSYSLNIEGRVGLLLDIE
mgnify:CR=1 FL=1